MATPGLLKITVFWNKDYDAIIPNDDVTNKISLRDSNSIVDLFMWKKFGNSSTSMKEVITTLILQGFDQKNRFFEGWSWLKFNNLGLAQSTNLKFYISLPTFVEVTGEKLVGVFLPPSPAPSWIVLLKPTSNSMEADLQILQDDRVKFHNDPLLGYLNINSLRNKVTDLCLIFKDQLKPVSETKLDGSLPTAPFGRLQN